jgi:endo-1,4-beta-D-glucanase Y
VGGILIVLVIGAILIARTATTPLSFSSTYMLGGLWNSYLTEFLEQGTYRTLDKSRNNITTSEGESYTMLRAVWMSDKTTFDRSWQWTKDNIQHKDDHLFAWLFGPRPGQSFGIVTSQGGNTTASDADTDIALALILAYARWQDPTYLGDARLIVADIWDKEVLVIGGKPYLVADDVEKTSTTPTALINPSYLNPAAYRIFARLDPNHPWGALADSSYTVLNQATTSPLGATTSASLPPDWVAINKTTGGLSAPPFGGTTDFGFDALRVPYRLALDYSWFKDPHDTALLAKMRFLSEAFAKNGKLAAGYTHAGPAPRV